MSVQPRERSRVRQVKLPRGFRGRYVSRYIGNEFVRAFRSVQYHVLLQYWHSKRGGVSGRHALDTNRSFTFPRKSIRTPNSESGRVLAGTHNILVGQHGVESEWASYIAVCRLNEEAPSNGRPAVLHGIESSGFPVAPESPYAFSRE